MELLPSKQQTLSDQEDSWFYAHIQQMHPVAVELLNISALLAAEDIPEELFTQGADAFEGALREIVRHPSILGRAIEDLLDHKLIEIQISKHTLCVASSVQSTLRDALSPSAIRHRFEQIICAIHHLILSSAEEAFTRSELLLPHVWQLAILSESWSFASVEVAEVFSWAGKKLLAQKNYDHAEQLLIRALEMYKQLYGDEHSSVATVLDGLASIDQERGLYKQAQNWLMRAYLIRMRVLGLDHPDTIFTFCNIGHVYALQGFLVEAERFYQQSLANCERVLGPEHPSTRTVIDNLASLYVELANQADTEDEGEEGKPVESDEEYEDEDEDDASQETLLQRIEFLHTRICNPSNIETARILHKLAFAYIGLQQWEPAEITYRRIIPVYDDAIGHAHPDTLACLEQFALLLMQRGNVDEAEAGLRQVHQIRERTLGSDHPDVAASLNNLGQLYILQEKFEQAEDVLEQSLVICTSAFGERHTTLTIILNNLIATYLAQGKRQQAQPLLLRQQRILEQQLTREEHKEFYNVQAL